MAGLSAASAGWRWPRPFPRLEGGAVHVWRTPLDTPGAAERLRPLLSHDERARADRFHFERDRRRYTVARAALRTLLGRYLAIAPDTVPFRYGERGKPSLAAPSDRSRLRFNLSHAHERMLCAVTLGREVGVDLEWMRGDVAFDEVAAHMFSAREAARLRPLEPDAKRRTFFRIWTRKEAYIKAIGQGLALPLDRFDVPISDDEPMRLSSDDHPAEIARWSLQPLPIDDGYAAALVVEGATPSVRRFTLTRGGAPAGGAPD